MSGKLIYKIIWIILIIEQINKYYNKQLTEKIKKEYLGFKGDYIYFILINIIIYRILKFLI